MSPDPAEQSFEETSRVVSCPYCWQPIEVLIDGAASNQEYVEDCQVCCRPMRVLVQAGLGEPDVTVSPEND